MDKTSRDYLNKILNKSIESLKEDHIAFLKARQSYLTVEQFKRYKHLLGDKTPRVEAPELPQNGHKTSLYDKPYKELQQMAHELLGIKVVGKSKKYLLEVLSNGLTRKD